MSQFQITPFMIENYCNRDDGWSACDWAVFFESLHYLHNTCFGLAPTNRWWYALVECLVLELFSGSNDTICLWLSRRVCLFLCVEPFSRPCTNRTYISSYMIKLIKWPCTNSTYIHLIATMGYTFSKITILLTACVKYIQVTSKTCFILTLFVPGV